jgi:hypothetical protein
VLMRCAKDQSVLGTGVVCGQARVSRGACVCVVFEASWAVWRRQLSWCGASPQGVVCKVALRFLGGGGVRGTGPL